MTNTRNPNAGHATNERTFSERKFHYHSRTRSTVHQHHSRTDTRRRPKSEVRPSGPAARRGADGLRSLDAFSATQPKGPEVGKSRSVFAFRRARLDVALLAIASDRLRSVARSEEHTSELPSH